MAQELKLLEAPAPRRHWIQALGLRQRRVAAVARELKEVQARAAAVARERKRLRDRRVGQEARPRQTQAAVLRQRQGLLAAPVVKHLPT